MPKNNPGYLQTKFPMELSCMHIVRYSWVYALYIISQNFESSRNFYDHFLKSNIFNGLHQTVRIPIFLLHLIVFCIQIAGSIKLCGIRKMWFWSKRFSYNHLFSLYHQHPMLLFAVKAFRLAVTLPRLSQRRWWNTTSVWQTLFSSLLVHNDAFG